MDYRDGEEIRVGDTIEYADGSRGNVVASIDDGVYSSDYSETEWSYLATGILVLTNIMGLVHYEPTSEIEFVLQAREGAN